MVIFIELKSIPLNFMNYVNQSMQVFLGLSQETFWVRKGKETLLDATAWLDFSHITKSFLFEQDSFRLGRI